MTKPVLTQYDAERIWGEKHRFSTGFRVTVITKTF